MSNTPSPEVLDRLAKVVGEKHALRDAAAMDGYMREWRQIWTGRSPLVLRPGSTAEVSRILEIANETRTAIVPQSPFARDRIASNTGTSFAVQALAASGEITPPKVTAEQFEAAKAKSEAEVPATVFLPEQDHP